MAWLSCTQPQQLYVLCAIDLVDLLILIDCQMEKVKGPLYDFDIRNNQANIFLADTAKEGRIVERLHKHESARGGAVIGSSHWTSTDCRTEAWLQVELPIQSHNTLCYQGTFCQAKRQCTKQVWHA